MVSPEFVCCPQFYATIVSLAIDAKIVFIINFK